MRVYHHSIEMNRQLAEVGKLLERRDGDLLRQLRRAAASVSLNIAEGRGSHGGNRELRFRTALGSAREVQACLDVAAAWGYLGPAGDAARVSVDHMIAMLFKLLASRP